MDSPKIDQRKRSVYLPKRVLDEVVREAERQRLPVSKMIQMAWMMAARRIKKAPAAEV